MQILFYIVFIISFFLMGVFQFFGVSITISSYILSILVAFGLLSILLIKKRVTINSYIITNLCFLLWIIISGLLNNKELIIIIYYASFVVLPLIIYFLVKQAMPKNENILLSLINVLIIIQLPVVSMQYLLPDYILYSQKIIAHIDRMFGTFPMSADHFVGFFLIMNIIYIFTSNNKLSVFHYFIIFMSVCTIFIMNSTVSYLLILIVLAYFLLQKFSFGMRFFFIFLGTSSLIVFLSLFDIMSVLNKGSIVGMFTHQSLINEGMATRFQTTYFLFTEGLSIYGNGPASYFNPFTGGFQINLNFSQIIWTYYDLGIVGLIFLFSLMISYVRLFKIKNDIKAIIFLLFFSYSFFSNPLDSLVFLMTLNIFSFLIQKHQKV